MSCMQPCARPRTMTGFDPTTASQEGRTVITEINAQIEKTAKKQKDEKIKAWAEALSLSGYLK